MDNAGLVFGGIVYLAIVVLVLAAMWQVYVKAGEPGWAAIVPFYNLWVLVRVARREWWWFILFFIPIANIVAILKLARYIPTSRVFELAWYSDKGRQRWRLPWATADPSEQKRNRSA